MTCLQCHNAPKILHFHQLSTFPIPQGPEFDEEEESELTVTELRERARKQKAELERRMMGDGSDNEEEEEIEEGESNKSQSKLSNEDSGCSWGIGELVLLVAGSCYVLSAVSWYQVSATARN